MSKKTLLFLFLMGCFLISLYYFGNQNAISGTNAGNNSPENTTPEGPPLVVPEGPYGTAGLLTALLASIVVLILIRRR